MTLEERLKELKGRYVKIGGKRGSGFIFIGRVEKDTIKVLNRIGKYYIARLHAKQTETINILKDWDRVVERMWVIENANYNKALATYKELILKKIAKRDEYAEKYGKTNMKYKKQVTSVRETAKTIAERIWFNRNYSQNIEDKRKYYEDSLELLTYQLETIKKFTDFEVLEDYMSVDSETYGGRILLVDTWITGKYWSLSEYDFGITSEKQIS